MSVKILADSTCDLSAELLSRYNVNTIPLYVNLDEQSFRDGIELTAPQLIERAEKDGSVFKTSASSVGDFADFFRPYAEAGHDIVYIGLSEKFSCQMQNSRLAAEEFPERVIRCVDSRNLSTGIGLLVIRAAELAQEGLDANAIADTIEEMREKVSASFVLDTLAYLHRGGRCSGLAAVGAALLSLKPQIVVEDGGMHPAEKFRGSIAKVAIKYMDKMLANLEAIDPSRVFITYSPGFDDAEIAQFVSHVQSKGYFKEVLSTSAGCVISTHCGPKCMGILFVNK